MSSKVAELPESMPHETISLSDLASNETLHLLDVGFINVIPVFFLLIVMFEITGEYSDTFQSVGLSVSKDVDAKGVRIVSSVE